MPSIEHVFVLMLENRSFDHMFGLSGIGGSDAETNAPTRVIGLSGGESAEFSSLRNTYASMYSVPSSTAGTANVPGH